MKQNSTTDARRDEAAEDALDDAPQIAPVLPLHATNTAPVSAEADPDDDVDDDGSLAVVFAVPDDNVCWSTYEMEESPNGLIQRFAAHYGREFAYRPSDGAWLRWDGRVWRSDARNVGAMNALRCVADAIGRVEAKIVSSNHPRALVLQQELKTAQVGGDDKEIAMAARKLKALKDSLESEHKRYALTCQGERALSAALNGAQAFMTVPEEYWDGPKHLLNFQNGVVNLRTGELLPHRPSWRFTQITACDYTPDAEPTPEMLLVLDHLSDGRAEVVEYLQRWFGQAITGEVSAASILFIHGEAQVGKSTYLNALMKCLGEGGDHTVSFASSAKPEAFQKKTASHDEGFHHLRRCRLVVINEVQGGMMDNGKLKAISGGDGYDSRRAGGSSEKYFPRMSIAMTSNKLVVVAPEDKGLMERFQPYQVTRNLPKNQRSKKVKEALESKAGMAAILAWAVRGSIKWYADGANNDALKAPAFFADELAEFTRDMDTLAGWLGDNIVLVDKAHTSGFPTKAIELYQNYRAYTLNKGMGKGMFYLELAKLGFPRTEKIRWTLTEGQKKGHTSAPAFWIPGLHIAPAWGDYDYDHPVRDLGGNVPLNEHDAFDNGCEEGPCFGCESKHCKAKASGSSSDVMQALPEAA